MSLIYLIRHGQASFGDENYDKLSELGIRQSGYTAEYFLKSGIVFDTFCCGTLERQKNTLNEIIKVYDKAGMSSPSPEFMEEFNEYDSLSLVKFFVPILIEKDPQIKADLDNALKSRKSFQKIYERVISEWCSGKYESDNLVTWEAFSNNVKSGLEKIMTKDGKGKKIAIVTSGGPISAIAGMALGIESEKTLKLGWEIVNTSVTRLKCTESAFMISTFNEYSHLETADDQSLVTYR